jgi:type IV pilus assembly protein PilB
MVLTLERQPLGQLLLGRGFVAPAQLETALAEQRRSPARKLLGEILVESRLCSEEQILEALAGSYGVPFARITPRLADAKVISVLPRDFVEREQVLPLFLVENVLTVAVVEPANLFLLDEIRRLTGHKVQPVAATPADIAATLRAYLPDDRLFAADEIPCDSPPETFSVLGGTDVETPLGATPVSRLARACLYTAIRDSATDIHVDPDESGARVRYRIDGRLVERMRLPAQTCGAFFTQLKDVAGIVGAPGVPAAGIIRVRIDGRLMELRLSVSPVIHGEKLVVRLGDQAKPPMRLEKLGFGYEPLKQWRKLIASLRGLLLVSGPAGSGKRTTLYSSVAELNAAELNVCAVEDRVGRALAGVNQFRVDAAAGYDRAAALRALLAQDPDVVMLPDTAEPEVARLAAGAAMAGRLVLCSVHAPDAAAAIPRLMTLGVDPYVLGVALAGVLAQRLVRRLCPHCREAVDATPGERKQLERYAGPVAALFRAKGCSHCRGTGYAGRIALFELLIPGEPLPDALARGGTRAGLQNLVQQAGMKPLRYDGAEKVKAGIITLEDFLTTLA